jgi:hypothetical protein
MATILRSSKDYRKPIGSHFRLHPVACTIKLVGATAGRALRRRVNALASVEERRHYVVQDGPAVYKAAVIGMAEVTEEILKRNDMTAADLARLVPHQANRRIIEAVAKRLGLGLDRVIINLDCYGNTVAPDGSYCALGVERARRLRARRPRRLVGLRCRVHRRQRLSALGDRLERSTFAQRALAHVVEVHGLPMASSLSLLTHPAPGPRAGPSRAGARQ